MKKETARKILQETEQGYDLISGKFSATRKNFWGSLEFIGDYTQNGDNILDFGCGNGRLLEILKNKKIEYYGADVSKELLQLGRARYLNTDLNVHFSKLDPLLTSLAFKSDFFNVVYSIATFHHFPGRDYRLAMAKELYRVCASGGHVVITVWNLHQKKYFKNILRNWKNKIFFKSELDWNDCYISFTDNQGKKFNRYHHAFTLLELKMLFGQAGFEIEKAQKVKNNLVIVGKKTKLATVPLTQSELTGTASQVSA